MVVKSIFIVSKSITMNPLILRMKPTSTPREKKDNSKASKISSLEISTLSWVVTVNCLANTKCTHFVFRTSIFRTRNELQ